MFWLLQWKLKSPVWSNDYINNIFIWLNSCVVRLLQWKLKNLLCEVIVIYPHLSFLPPNKSPRVFITKPLALLSELGTFTNACIQASLVLKFASQGYSIITLSYYLIARRTPVPLSELGNMYLLSIDMVSSP